MRSAIPASLFLILLIACYPGDHQTPAAVNPAAGQIGARTQEPANIAPDTPRTDGSAAPRSTKVKKTDAEWRAQLSDMQYRVAREKGTERAFTGEYWDNHTPGTYTCVCCGAPLFDAKTKFDSGTGWPSFYQPIDQEAVAEDSDRSLGMTRTEATCSRCDAHLGHVFDDGPRPTGLRYCINSASLKLIPAPDQDADQHR